MKHYLLDASAFMFLMKKSNAKGVIECLQDSRVLDLTYYEVGNAIWKESTLTKFLTPEDSKTLEKVAQTILMNTDRIASEAVTFQKILEIAKNEKLSFYIPAKSILPKKKTLNS